MTVKIKDCVEIYDDPKYNLFFNDYARPPPCFKEKAYTERFCKHLHTQVLHRLLILTAIIMEMDDEEALAKLHTFDALSDCRMRYMVQHPRMPEELKVLEQADDGEDDIIYRHTDFGTYTLLSSQPVAALQARSKGGKWKWVRPVSGSIIGNVGVCYPPLICSDGIQGSAANGYAAGNTRVPYRWIS